MAGITGLALDPYGEQINAAGKSLGAGIDTMVQRSKAEAEANAPVHPMAEAALKLRALQQEFPGRSAEELGKILQLRESGHPSFAPQQQPQQQAPAQQQAVPVQVQAPVPQPVQPGPDQVQSAQQQLTAPAPAGGQVGAAPSLGAQAAQPAQQATLAQVAAPVKAADLSVRTGVPQPGTAVAPAQGTKVARPDSLNQLESFMQSVGQKAAPAAPAAAPKEDQGPIILSDEQKARYSTPIRNKDFATINTALAGKSADMQAKVALQIQKDAAAMERERLRQQGTSIRLAAGLDSKTAIVETMADTRLTLQQRNEAKDIFLNMEKMRGQLEAIHMRAAAAGSMQDKKLAIQLLKASADIQAKATGYATQMASAFGAAPEVVQKGMESLTELQSFNARIQGALDEVSQSLGTQSAIPGPSENYPDQKVTEEDKSTWRSMFGMPGPTKTKTIPGGKKPDAPAQGLPRSGRQSSGKVQFRHKSGKVFELDSTDPRIQQITSNPDFTQVN